jgi:phosphatidylserine decarboxylase
MEIHFINFVIDYIFNREQKQILFKDYKKIIHHIFGYILDNTCSETITKLLFPIIVPIYPVTYKYNKDIFFPTTNNYKDVFLRKYKKMYIDKNSRIINPVDGLFIESNKINDNSISINNILLSLDKIFYKNTPKFNNYCYNVFYLRYNDYHYVHFPINCKVLNIINIPGKYYWMEPSIEFGCKFIGKNHRKIYVFLDTTTNKKCYLIMIASIIVGGIHTIFYNENKMDESEYYNIDLSSKNIMLNKGDFLANFYIGSMVLYLYSIDDTLYKTKNFSLKDEIKIGKNIHMNSVCYHNK